MLEIMSVMLAIVALFTSYFSIMKKRWQEDGEEEDVYKRQSENNAAQYYPDYAYNPPVLTPNHKIYSDSIISRFLSEIVEDERIAFLNDWNEKRNHREKIYISYDSTNKNCEAGDVEKAEYGHPKEDAGAPIVNYASACFVWSRKNMRS